MVIISYKLSDLLSVAPGIENRKEYWIVRITTVTFKWPIWHKVLAIKADEMEGHPSRQTDRIKNKNYYFTRLVWLLYSNKEMVKICCFFPKFSIGQVWVLICDTCFGLLLTLSGYSLTLWTYILYTAHFYFCFCRAVRWWLQP